MAAADVSPATPPLLDAAGVELPQVSPGQRARARAILQTLIDEASGRKWVISRGSGGTTLTLSVEREECRLTLHEEDDLLDVVPSGEVAAKRFGWQRVSPRQELAPSGRLALRLDYSYASHRNWADRSRWRLEDKLREAVTFVDSLGRQAAQRRSDARARALEELAQWEAAVGEARRRFIKALNRERMASQAESAARSRMLRDYADQICPYLSGESDLVDAALLRQWQDAIYEEAKRVDPFESPRQLQWVEPAEIRHEDIERYMPRGLSVYRRPEVPD
jgi:hypothetical protein